MTAKKTYSAAIDQTTIDAGGMNAILGGAYHHPPSLNMGKDYETYSTEHVQQIFGDKVWQIDTSMKLEVVDICLKIYATFVE
jgi:hypothetical protein